MLTRDDLRALFAAAELSTARCGRAAPTVKARLAFEVADAMLEEHERRLPREAPPRPAAPPRRFNPYDLDQVAAVRRIS